MWALSRYPVYLEDMEKNMRRSSEDPVKQKTGSFIPERIPGADLIVYLHVSFLLSVIIIVGASLQ